MHIPASFVARLLPSPSCRLQRIQSISFATLALLVALANAPALAQDDANTPDATTSDVDSLLRDRGIDESSSVASEMRNQQGRRKSAEKELRRVRLKNFGTVKKIEIRQEGLATLRSHTDPALFPLMIDIFSREQNDVRDAMLDMFKESASREGDASLAWLAIYGRDAYLRSRGADLLAERIEAETTRAKLETEAAAKSVERSSPSPVPTDQVPPAQHAQPTHQAPKETIDPSPAHIATTPRHDPVDAARIVIYEGLRRGGAQVKARAAELAANLKLVQLIPWLAAAQVSGRPSGGGDGGGGNDNGALAYIVVGTQQAFVADLTPVVSENAVAFDPTLSTITEGTVLRVIDAVVYTYHVEIHQSLVRLASEAAGRDLSSLGWDYRAWMGWYRDEYQVASSK